MVIPVHTKRRKLNRLKPKTLLRFITEVRSQELCHRIWRGRQADKRTTTYQSEAHIQKPLQEAVSGRKLKLYGLNAGGSV